MTYTFVQERSRKEDRVSSRTMSYPAQKRIDGAKRSVAIAKSMPDNFKNVLKRYRSAKNIS